MTYQEWKALCIDKKRCIRRGCTKPPCADSFECAPHWEESKERKNKSAKRTREWLRRQLDMGRLFVR